MKNSSSAVDAVRAAQKRAAQIAIEAEAKASKLFEEAEREARLFFAKRGSLRLIPFILQFLVFLIFTFFVIYWVLFSLAQGDAIIIEESSNWLYWTIILGPLIPEPSLFLFSILGQQCESVRQLYSAGNLVHWGIDIGRTTEPQLSAYPFTHREQHGTRPWGWNRHLDE